MKTSVGLATSFNGGMQQDAGGFRPVTATRAAGFTSRGRTSMGKTKIANPFDAIKNKTGKAEAWSLNFD